jgi:hypothetical protein
MTYPDGVSLSTLTFSNPITFLGNAATRTEVTIAPSASVVWGQTGQPIDATAELVSPGDGLSGSLMAPHVDQDGFLDQDGNAFTGWAYLVTRRAFFGSVPAQQVQKTWQPLVGQDVVDFDLLPGGPVGEPVSAPVIPVTSVAGETGVVGAEALSVALTPYLPNDVTPASVAAALPPGTASQYLRGDRTFQSLAKGDVGLGNVDNTSDASKPVSTATQTALNGKANTAHTHPMTDLTGTLTPGQIPAATSSAAGSMSAADKTKLDAATSAGTASVIVMRDINGNLNTGTPTASTHGANKSYVDGLVGTDTGWQTTGLTITPATDWTVTSYRVRKIKNSAWFSVQVTYSGADFATGADGNMTDKIVATLPTGYRPAASWPVMVSEWVTRMWGGVVATDGTLVLSHGLPSRTVTTGNSFFFHGHIMTD